VSERFGTLHDEERSDVFRSAGVVRMVSCGSWKTEKKLR
jgi:hypothetical protein